MSTTFRRASSGLYIPRTPPGSTWATQMAALPNLVYWSRLADASSPFTDATGAGHNITWGAGVSSISGATSDGDAAAAAGTAASSLTSASWMDAPSKALYVIAWIKTSTTGSERHAFSRYTNNTNFMFSLGVSSTNKAIWRCKTSASNNLPTGTTTVTNGAWHLLVGTYDGSTMKLYVDGSLEASGGLSLGTGLSTGQNLRIGQGYTSALWASGDGIDEVAFGGVATSGAANTLSATDVSNLWAAA